MRRFEFRIAFKMQYVQSCLRRYAVLNVFIAILCQAWEEVHHETALWRAKLQAQEQEEEAAAIAAAAAAAADSGSTTHLPPPRSPPPSFGPHCVPRRGSNRPAVGPLDAPLALSSLASCSQRPLLPSKMSSNALAPGQPRGRVASTGRTSEASSGIEAIERSIAELQQLRQTLLLDNSPPLP